MNKIRVHKNGEFIVMSNYHLQDNEMTLKAKGLLSTMLSLPPKWDYSVAGLKTLSKDGRDSITSALLELEKHGYLVRERVTDQKGRFAGYDYHIYERPFTENPSTENPSTENPQESNIKESNIKEIISYLNSAISANYRYQSKANRKHIQARLNEGYTVEDFKAVIDKKVAEWKGTEMAQYLRPETLFGSKFESYLNAPKTTAKTANTHFSNERQYTKAEMDALITDIDDIDF